MRLNLGAITDLKNCPTAGCENGYDGTGSDKVEEWFCDSCKYTYCLKCKVFIWKMTLDSKGEYERNEYHSEKGDCEKYQKIK
jgi:hypothetical protein